MRGCDDCGEAASLAPMSDLVVHPITRGRFADVEALFATDSTMRSCWDIWPRFTRAQWHEQAQRVATDGGRGLSYSETNRVLLRRLAARRVAPGLLAYDGREAVGFLSLGPRPEMRRVAASRATPAVDDLPAWVIPCFFVRKSHRGRGVTVALLRAAVKYAGRQGAPAVEGYPRADRKRVHDVTAFFGTVAQFRRAGYRKVAGPQRDAPKNFVPRATMRALCDPPAKRAGPSRRRAAAA